jgi:LCP family protein required for cell wall assembly
MQDTQPYRRPSRAQAERLRREVPRRRRRINWRRRIGFFVLVLLAVAVAGVVLVWQRAVAFNDAVSTESALSVRLFGPFGGGDRVNVLLLGYSDESREGAFLSDSMNVISIDRATDTTTMIPIPRDLWVEGVAEVPQNMKINEAFALGTFEAGLDYGAELAVKAVTVVTGLPIHGWISLDFQGFEAMVDELDGVAIDNPTAFAYTWLESEFVAGSFQYSFDAGPLHLNGQQALDYARARYTSAVDESSDFARLVRQQRVLQAIRAEVNGWQALPIGLGLADSLVGHLRTNLSAIDLGMLAGKLEVDRRIEMREDEIITATTNTLGQYVLVVIGQDSPDDYSPLHAFLSRSLDGPLASPPATTPAP